MKPKQPSAEECLEFIESSKGSLTYFPIYKKWSFDILGHPKFYKSKTAIGAVREAMKASKTK